MYLVNAEQMRQMDEETINDFGIPGAVLMESAGRGAFDMIMREFPDIRSMEVCILAGRGNNGGDAFVVARYLMEQNIEVNIFLLSSISRVKGDAKTNLELVQKMIREYSYAPITEIPDEESFNNLKEDILDHDLYVDGILGTGLSSDVTGFFREVIHTVNLSRRPVFSIDIPSGLNADTGKPCGIAVKATATATFGHAKTGHILYPGDEHTGKLGVIDIGIPEFITRKYHSGIHLLETEEVKNLFRPREKTSHKGDFGHAFILAGSPGKTGAAVLAANAAARCGAGLVTLGVPESINNSVEPQVTEPMTCPLAEDAGGCVDDSAYFRIVNLLKDKDAFAFGPGSGTGSGTAALLKKLVRTVDIPFIIDADGLAIIAEEVDMLKDSSSGIILTPHPGEMARLTGKTAKEVQENRLECAREFADKYGVILVLKGAKTVIALPEGGTFICPAGNPGMATGGMGDVLTGIITSLAVQGFNPETAAAAGVHIHALAGDLLLKETGGPGFLASDMLKAIPEIINTELT
ncbi:MAG: NAD(P)H-hydrate dehydratase [Desulfobacteraceae bacterium]